MARIQYEADGSVPPERFIAALTDFNDRRPELWPGLDAEFVTPGAARGCHVAVDFQRVAESPE